MINKTVTEGKMDAKSDEIVGFFCKLFDNNFNHVSFTARMDEEGIIIMEGCLCDRGIGAGEFVIAIDTNTKFLYC